MHESPVHKIISIAQSQAQARGVRKVKTVRVRLAAWSEIDAESLQREFAEEAKTGVTENAHLQIEVVEPKCECTDCGAILEPNIVALRCTKCNSLRVTLQHPHEMEVDVEA